VIGAALVPERSVLSREPPLYFGLCRTLMYRTMKPPRSRSLLRQAIDEARYPFAPRLDPPKAIRIIVSALDSSDKISRPQPDAYLVGKFPRAVFLLSARSSLLP